MSRGQLMTVANLWREAVAVYNYFMFSSPWHLLLFDRLGVTIIGTLTIIGGKAV